MEGPLLRPLPCWRQRSGGLTVDPAGSAVPYHVPVLVADTVRTLSPSHSGVILDATYGGGGHTAALLAALPAIRVLALDRDPDAAPDPVPDRVTFMCANFADLAELAVAEGVDELAGALFDLGVSSHQLDTPDRGFAFRVSGPLDMRMGPDAGQSAEEMVNRWDRDRLARVIFEYGEERAARRIAAAIVAARPINDTAHLADVVAGAMPGAFRRRGHPARRTFQALRIAANDELHALERGLEAAIDLLRPGGRIVVIAYHSLEDRIVKRRFAAGAAGCVCPPDMPVCGCGKTAELRILTRRPIRPAESEIEANPRARSARLRGAEKVAA